MDILVYTKDNCPYCTKAKMFLAKKNLSYSEKKVGVDLTSEEYRSKINSTVPAIFIDGNFIGGYDDLVWLNGMKPEMFNG
jgi:glutaredoxin 3